MFSKITLEYNPGLIIPKAILYAYQEQKDECLFSTNIKLVSFC